MRKKALSKAKTVIGSPLLAKGRGNPKAFATILLASALLIIGVATLASSSTPDCLASNNCFPKPVNTGPGATGIPPGINYSAACNIPNGDTITTNNFVVDSCTHNGSLTIEANDVTIKNARITGSIRTSGAGANYHFTVEDSNIGPASGCGSYEALIGVQNYTARRNYLHNNGDAFRAAYNGKILVEDNFSILCSNSGDHSDGIQGLGSGQNVTVNHNTFDQRPASSVTAPVFFADNSSSAFVIDNLLLSTGTGSQALRIHDDHNPDIGPWDIRGNRVIGIANTDQLECGASTTTWNNNRQVTVDGSYNILSTGNTVNCNGTTSPGGGSTPTASLSANPTSVSSGSASALTWTSTNSTSCTASANPSNANWTGTKATSGSGVTTGNLTQTTTFSLTCTDGSTTSSASTATVTIAGPTASLSANPTSVNSGSASALTWSSTNSTSCTASANPSNANWTGTKATSGTNVSTGNLTVTTTFSLTCTNGSTTSSASTATVTIAAPQTSCSGSSDTICEDFSASASNFTATGGTWGVSGGKYNLTNPTVGPTGQGLNSMALHATTVSGDFELTADGSTTATSNDYNDFGIIFNYQDANNFYFAHFAETNDATGGGVFKVAAGTQTRLVAFTPTVTPGTTYAVKVTKTGSAIEAFLNNATLGSATDSTFTGGKVGLGSRNDSAIFDNLIVTTSGGGPTYRAADINEDNVVNIFDLSILITNFGRNASTWTDPRANVYDEAGDTDVVNIFDLSALLSAFGT